MQAVLGYLKEVPSPLTRVKLLLNSEMFFFSSSYSIQLQTCSTLTLQTDNFKDVSCEDAFIINNIDYH